MHDPRFDKLAHGLVNFSTKLTKGEKVLIDAFDIRDPQYKKDSFAYGVPKPSIFIVDKSGVVRAKLAEEGYKVRPPSEAIVSSIDALGQK